MDSEILRVTPTNSASDSEGAIWGISGDQLWLVLVGVFLSSGTWLALWRLTECEATIATVLSLLPATVAVGCALFKQSHPAGYLWDLLESRLCCNGFGPAEPPPTETAVVEAAPSPPSPVRLPMPNIL